MELEIVFIYIILIFSVKRGINLDSIKYWKEFWLKFVNSKNEFIICNKYLSNFSMFFLRDELLFLSKLFPFLLILILILFFQ